jgi:hypothetical protein
MTRAGTQTRNIMSRIPMMLFMILGLALLNHSACGQAGATILGTVTDPTGAVIPNAKVTLVNENNGFVRTTTSNGAGSYSAPDLQVGNYQIEVQAGGFKTYEQQNITLNVNSVVRIDAKLQVGAVGQTVTVEANAIQVQADTSDISQTITSNQIANLSTNGRNILQLTTLVPGASSNMPDFDLPGAQWQNRSIYFNGMRQDANDWQIDGGEAYDRGGGGILLVSPSQDAIGEFKVQTSNYAADEGNASGGMTTMELKSGTKQFHASAWEYNRNDAFDAYSYFSKHATNPTKPELRYNAYGFNVGGPAEFRSSNPKTFFFYNMEWRKLTQGGSINNAVPTCQEFGFGSNGCHSTTVSQNPDMSAFGIPIYVPVTTDQNLINKFAGDGLTPGQQFPNNQIPLNLVDPSIAAYLKAGYMLPPNESDGLHYFSAANTITPYREEIVRMDQQFGEKLRLMGNLIWDSTTQQAPTVSWSSNTYPTVGSLETVPSWQGVVRLTDSISPSLLNETSWDTNGNNITIANTGLWQIPSGFNVSPFYSSAYALDKKFSGLDFSAPNNQGVTMDDGNWPWQNWWRSNAWKDDLSWISGHHNLKFGFEYMYTTKKQQIFTNTSLTYHFYGGATSGCSVYPFPKGVTNCKDAGGTSSPGIGMADFLLGLANDASQSEIQDFVDIANKRYDLYGMDDWRITPRLTINLGIRWEGLPHAYDINGRLSSFYDYLYNPANAAVFIPGTNGDLQQYDASGNLMPGWVKGSTLGVKLSNDVFYTNGIGLAGKNGVPKSLVTDHYMNIAPRLGFEYDLFGDGRTILRGGGGIFFEENAGNEEYNGGANVPFNNSASTSQPYVDTPGVSWLNGAGAAGAPATPQSITGVQPDLPISDVYQFNLGIQHQLSSNMVATLGFVGNTSSHLSQTVDINYVPLSDPDRADMCGSPCGVTGITDPTLTNNNYHRTDQGFSSLNLVYDEGNSHYDGIQATVRAQSYHNLSLDFAYTYSHTWDVIDGQLFNNLDVPFNPRFQYGTSGFDRRQIAVANFNYNLPIFQNSNGAARNVLGGWTVSGVTTMETGNPLNVGSWNSTGLPVTDHPVVSGKIGYPHSINKWFSPEAFSEPGPLQFGTAGKNWVKGPGRDAWSLSMFKTFKFTERTGFRFQADAFNAFNHTQWTSIATGVLSGATPTSYNSTAGEVQGTADPRVFQFGGRLFF